MSLKPVVFVQGKYAYNRQDTSQQIMLLKALKITQNPNKLRELIGVRTVAEVYRTLDKIAMRKEYHKSLADKGITFDYIVDNLKKEIDTAEKSSDRLNGINMLLKSIGLDKYEESAINSGNWEDALAKLKEERGEGVIKKEAVKEYEVVIPQMPEHVKKAKEEQNAINKKLYE